MLFFNCVLISISSLLHLAEEKKMFFIKNAHKDNKFSLKISCACMCETVTHTNVQRWCGNEKKNEKNFPIFTVHLAKSETEEKKRKMEENSPLLRLFFFFQSEIYPSFYLIVVSIVDFLQWFFSLQFFFVAKNCLTSVTFTLVTPIQSTLLLPPKRGFLISLFATSFVYMALGF